MLLPGVLVRSGWDRLLLLLPFSTSPVFSMGGVFEFGAVCSPVSFPSEAKKHKHRGERMKIKSYTEITQSIAFRFIFKVSRCNNSTIWMLSLCLYLHQLFC